MRWSIADLRQQAGHVGVPTGEKDAAHPVERRGQTGGVVEIADRPFHVGRQRRVPVGAGERAHRLTGPTQCVDQFSADVAGGSGYELSSPS